MRQHGTRRAGWLSVACLLAAAGCSDDATRPEAPVADGGSWTEAQALAEIRDIANRAGDELADMHGLVSGAPDGPFGLYDWNGAAGRWESRYGFGGSSLRWQWSFALTFRAADGSPVRDPAAAVTAEHATSARGIVATAADTTVTIREQLVRYWGLAGDVVHVAVEGRQTIEIATVDGAAGRRAMTWSSGEAPLSIPAAGGCPTGEVAFTLAPYAATASAVDGLLTVVLSDASGRPVDGGALERTPACAAP